MGPSDTGYPQTFTFGDRATTVRFEDEVSPRVPPGAVWIADENTRRYAPEDALVVPAGESAKSWETTQRVLAGLVARAVEREGTVVGVGGGVVCDLAAFAASIYARGIHLILLPTSLLAMVDAALGGKTGIDFAGYKNMVGTFYPAETLILRPAYLDTLPEREFKSGLAEAIKTALLGDEELLRVLEHERERVLDRDHGLLRRVVGRCLVVKGAIASADFREGGGRAVLNLGHTFGHALEAVTGMSKYTHGEAVAWGIHTATQLAVRRGRCGQDYLNRVTAVLDAYGFDLAPVDIDPEELIAAMYHDKKTSKGQIQFVLQSGVGEQRLQAVPAEEIRDVLGYSS